MRDHKQEPKPANAEPYDEFTPHKPGAVLRQGDVPSNPHRSPSKAKKAIGNYIGAHRARLVKISLSALILLLLAGMGIWFWYIQPNRHNRAQTENETYAAVIQQADGALRGGNTNQAKKVLNDFMETNPKGKDHLYNVELRLAIIARNQNDFKSAKEQGEAALKHHGEGTYDLYTILAESSLKEGDKKAALGYYQKCIDVLSKQKTINAAARINSIRTTMGAIASESK
jgi:Tfp pilus assembly protein PilF